MYDNPVKKAYFIGIAGAGMSAVAILLKENGWHVSGSDEGGYPPVSTYLERHAIPFHASYAAQNVPLDADVVVVGKHAKLTAEHIEVKEALRRNLSLKSYPDILRELTKDTENIVIAGSSGKSTCAALMSWVLRERGLDPSYFIGAIPQTPPESAHRGSGSIFILEGDEYPSSNFDHTSKFLHYNARHLLLTSLTHDHFNVFKTPEDFRAPFEKLIASIPPQGTVVACRDDAGIRETFEKLGRTPVWYSLSDHAADWYAKNIKLNEISTFGLVHKGEVAANLSTTLLGMHNVENIVGVSALLLTLQLATPAELARAASTFKTLHRRLDKKSERTKIPIYEGFGSSYAKARAAIEAMRLHFRGRRLVVLFEPHTFSWRSEAGLPWYDSVFEGVDKVYVYKPPVHGKDTHAQIDLPRIVERIEKSGTPVVAFDEPAEGLRAIEADINKDSAVLILSSGGMGGMITSLVSFCEKEFPLP